MPDSDPIITRLTDFGLSPAEARIYLSLTGKGFQTVMELSRATGLPRTTLYDLLEKLSGRGLIEKVIRYKSTSYRAFPVAILLEEVKKQEARAAALKSGYEELQQLIPAQASQTPQTQVRYYHGAHGFRQMMTRALSAEKETVGYSVFGRARVVGADFVSNWNRQMAEKGIRDRVIASSVPEIVTYLARPEEKSARDPFQSTRYLSKSLLYISGDTTIYNRTFAVCWWDKGEVVGVEIDNPELVRMQKSVFEILWNLAKPQPDAGITPPARSGRRKRS